MLGTCLRRLVVILSLVAVAAFAGHGSAMAGGMMSRDAPGHGHPVSASPAEAGSHASHAGNAHDNASGAMSCCGKSCASILPFPEPPRLERGARISDPPPLLRDDREGVRPSGPKRPPKLA